MDADFCDPMDIGDIQKPQNNLTGVPAMPWGELLVRIMALPQWAAVSVVAWAARLVEPYFRGWMREYVYVTAIDAALTFAERSIVEGGEGVPLNLPGQIARISDAASAAARSTWEDDLDPDSRPSGYASSAYAAADAAAAVSALLRGLGLGLREQRQAHLVESLASSLASAKHSAGSNGSSSYEAYTMAEGEAEAEFIRSVMDQVLRVENALANGVIGSTGMPWELFCAENPIASPRYGGAGAAQVFMSYGHVDSRFATRLYRELRRCNVSCWLDEHDIRAGDRVADSLGDAIRGSTQVIVCCSQASLGSRWVRDELRVAQQEEHRRGSPIVIPVLLDRFLLDGWVDDLADELRSRVAVDFAEWERSPQEFNRAFMKLYKALRTSSG